MPDVQILDGGRIVMTDKDLLKLAAKAAGIELTWVTWNPLTDNGEALRLAVHLDINVHTKGDCVYLRDKIVAYNPIDIYAATRRAIVCAAAEIGKGMK